MSSFGRADPQRGGYIGEPPRGSGGFGRKSPPLNAPVPDAFTLSQASQPPAEWHEARAELSNDIDFAILGQDIQAVEIELDPGEAVIADNGAMIWKDDAIEFSSTFGDGSEKGGIFDKIVSAGANALAGENLFVSEFRHAGHQGKARVCLGGHVPGHIIPIRLEAMGGTLICQRDSFLAAAKGISISIAFQRNLGTALVGGEGFIMQKLTGTGWAFLHMGGSIIERELQRGEMIQVDTGCVAAYEPSVSFSIARAGSWGSRLTGGEGLFFATLAGPGKVWIQTLPFRRLAEEAAAAAPRFTDSSGSGGETSIMDGINTLRKLF